MTETWKRISDRYKLSNRGRMYDSQDRKYLNPVNRKSGTHYRVRRFGIWIYVPLQPLMRRYWGTRLQIRFGKKWLKYVRQHNQFSPELPVPRFSQIMKPGKQEWGA